MRTGTQLIFIFVLATTVAVCATHVYSRVVGQHARAVDVSGSNNIGNSINAADTRLGPEPGSIYVLTSGVINVPVHVSAHHKLIFSKGTWTFTGQTGIKVDSYSEIKGYGVGQSTLIMGNPSGSLIVSDGYDELHGLEQRYVLHPDALQKSPSSSGQPEGERDETDRVLGTRLVSISDLTLSGTFKKGSDVGSATGIRIYGFWFNISNVLIENFSGNGAITEYVSSGLTKGSNATESYINNVKTIGNGRDGWLFRGPHDSIVSGLIAAKNGEWGIDVQHREGFYSGGGLMLTNVHAYGNVAGGVRTQAGANILAFGLESEANHGPGVLLRSNDNIVHGEFYTNKTYGLQLGYGASYAGANYIDGQFHNNGTAQLNFAKSSGYNYVSGVLYASKDQAYVDGAITREDTVSVVTGGEGAGALPQHLQGGITFDTDGGIHGLRSINGVPATSFTLRPHETGVGGGGSAGARLSVVPAGASGCELARGAIARVSWVVPHAKRQRVRVMVANPGSRIEKLFASGGAAGGADTGNWVHAGTRFSLVESNTGSVLSVFVVPGSFCALREAPPASRAIKVK